jgi:hypothetical protein
MQLRAAVAGRCRVRFFDGRRSFGRNFNAGELNHLAAAVASRDGRSGQRTSLPPARLKTAVWPGALTEGDTFGNAWPDRRGALRKNGFL